MTGEHAMEVLAGVNPRPPALRPAFGQRMDGLYARGVGAHPAPVGGVSDALYDGPIFEDFDVDRARRCGFLTVIPKPISADTL